MLFKETVAPATLALLKKLCSEPLLQDFALGGGTGIALQKGHRISVDLDFFTNQPFTIAEDCRLIHQDDIVPMKLQAVSNRFAKKDFYDIETLLSSYTLEEMLNIFTQKFPDIDTGFLIHSLTHFDKADEEENPILLPASKSWKQVKENLQKAVRAYTLNAK
jgi:predicted nucleotidyltransferase component of viral defense system